MADPKFTEEQLTQMAEAVAGRVWVQNPEDVWDEAPIIYADDLPLPQRADAETMLEEKRAMREHLATGPEGGDDEQQATAPEGEAKEEAAGKPAEDGGGEASD